MTDGQDRLLPSDKRAVDALPNGYVDIEAARRATPSAGVGTDTVQALAGYHALVDGYLRDLLGAASDLSVGLVEILRYCVLAPGKRVRPILALLTAETLGHDARDVLPIACSVELIHTQSLIHDDLPAMDDSTMRRGREACHVHFGEGLAVLAGDTLYPEALNLILSRQQGPADRVLAAAREIVSTTGTSGLATGQYLDLTLRSDADAEVVQAMLDLKTASLIRAPMRAVCAWGDAPAPILQALDTYAINLGRLYQMVDDKLDVVGDPATIGKDVSVDERMGRQTYVSVHGVDGLHDAMRLAHSEMKQAIMDLPQGVEQLAQIADWLLERGEQAGSGPDAAVRKTQARKTQHLHFARREDAVHREGTELDRWRLCHHALPERHLDDVKLDVTLAGKNLAAPILISSMTGGVPESIEVNRRLAHAAVKHGAGFAVGSGRLLLDQPELRNTYFNPDEWPRPPLLAANLGAAQIVGPDGPAHAEALLSCLQADALIVHVNPLQESVQPEGQPQYAGVAKALAKVVERVAPVPVVVKEVGFGMSLDDLRLIAETGAQAIDVAGSGGTNWALIEGMRTAEAARVAQAFANWGIPTASVLELAAEADIGVPLIASGGLRDGVDATKCLALGASAAGFARTFLLAAQKGVVDDVLKTTIKQIRIATWLCGVADVNELGREHLVRS